jgi:hypothetical protein
VTPPHQEPRTSPPSGDLPFWARAADVVTIALLFLAVLVTMEGGFVFRPAGLRLSIRSEWRLFMWAGALTVLRHLIVMRPPLHRRIIAGVGAAARAAGPLRDDLVLFGRGRIDQVEPGPGGTRSKITYVLSVVLLYLGLTALMTYPQVHYMNRGLGDLSDSLLSTWRLSWIAHQLTRDPLHLYDANIFFPELRTLAYSDAMLVPSLTVAPLVWMGVHQILAYNVLFLSGFVLSGVAMFMLVQSLTRHESAAIFAGFVFAFLPYRFMHYAHLELQMAYWMPLCLWAFHKTVSGGRLRDGLASGLFLALQTLSSWYYGIFLATYLVPFGAVLLIGSNAGTRRQAVRSLVAGALLAAILVAPFAVPYFRVRESTGERSMFEINFYSATPRNYLDAHSRNALFGPLTAGRGQPERELFQGIAAPLIALVGLWPPLSAARMAYATGLVVAFDVSLGFNGVLYKWLHAYVLPYRGLRVPARMAILVGLSLAVLGGCGVARLCARLGGRRATTAASLALVVLVAVEYRSTLKLEQIWTRPPPVYDWLRTQPPSVVLELPMIYPDIALEPKYMYFSTFHWHKLVNGYSGFSPPSYARLFDLMSTFPNDAALAELDRRGVDFVIAHGAFYTRAAYDDLVSRLDGRRDLSRVGVFRWQGRDTRVYRVLRSEPGLQSSGR